MASTYVNDLRLNEMATGDASGSWGTVTNTNLELIGEAFSYGTETIGDADSTLTIADGAADAARSFYLKITSSVDLTTTRIVTLGPNTVSKVWMIENATTGSQVITIKQGSGATINVPNGQVKMISTDGAGSGGAVLDLLVDVDLTGTTTLVNLDVSGAVDIAGDLTLSAGGDGALRFTAASSVKVLDNNAAALVFEEADNAYMTFVTTDGSEAVKFDKALDINAATQIDATVTVGVDDTGYDVKFFGATAGKYMLWDESADTLEVSGTVVADGLTVDGTSTVRDDAATTSYYSTDVASNVVTHISNGTGAFAQEVWKLNDGGTASERMRLTTTGLGIGTSSPDVNLSVFGSAAVGADVGGEISIGGFYDGSSKTSYGSIAGVNQNGTGNTSGQLLFKTRTNFGSLTERMRLDSSGNVGIGVSNPSSYQGNADNLVVGNLVDAGTGITIVSGTASLGSIHFADSPTGDDSYRGFIQYDHVSNFMRFATNATERMRIDSSGNVGIGVVPPTDAHATWSQLFLGEKGSYISEKSNSGGIYGNFVTDNLYIDADTGAFANITTDQSSAYRQEAGVHHWYSQASGSAGAAVTLSEKMTINSSGNVGIGTSSPVNIGGYGGLTLNGTTGSIFSLMTNGTETTRFVGIGNETSIQCAATTGFISFVQGLSGGTERMRIDSGGGVRINNTADATFTAQLNTQFTNAKNCGLYLKVTNTSVTQSMIIFGNTINDAVGSITTNGAATTYATSSDYRLKTDAQPMTGASARVLALKPVNFAWIVDGSRVDGFLAHEAQAPKTQCVTNSMKSQQQSTKTSSLQPCWMKKAMNLRLNAQSNALLLKQSWGHDQFQTIRALTKVNLCHS
jgi:hypothetical protein